MKIIEALTFGGVRLTYGARWLVWDEVFETWIVYERRRYMRNTKTIVETKSEEEAVNKLFEEVKK